MQSMEKFGRTIPLTQRDSPYLFENHSIQTGRKCGCKPPLETRKITWHFLYLTIESLKSHGRNIL
jgi:hypothetical protein